MNFIFYNPNPQGKVVDDCSIRAITKFTGMDWDKTFILVTTMAFEMKDMPSANAVWGKVLEDLGYIRVQIPNTCPNCYTVKDFCSDHPVGRYLIAAESHVVAVVDGNYYDTWDSGDKMALYFWTMRKE